MKNCPVLEAIKDMVSLCKAKNKYLDIPRLEYFIRKCDERESCKELRDDIRRNKKQQQRNSDAE